MKFNAPKISILTAFVLFSFLSVPRVWADAPPAPADAQAVAPPAEAPVKSAILRAPKPVVPLKAENLLPPTGDFVMGDSPVSQEELVQPTQSQSSMAGKEIASVEGNAIPENSQINSVNNALNFYSGRSLYDHSGLVGQPLNSITPGMHVAIDYVDANGNATPIVSGVVLGAKYDADWGGVIGVNNGDGSKILIECEVVQNVYNQEYSISSIQSVLIVGR